GEHRDAEGDEAAAFVDPVHDMSGSEGMLRVEATNQSGWRLRIDAAARLATLPVSNSPKQVAPDPDIRANPESALISAAFAAPIDGSMACAAASRSLRVSSSQLRTVWKSKCRGSGGSFSLSRRSSAAKTAAVATPTPGLTSTSPSAGKSATNDNS